MKTIDFEFLNTVKGFMDDAEVRRLHEVACTAAAMGPILEIGSYCGRSAAVIGWACRDNDSVLYSIDHHTGSEEQQPGEAYFDPDLYDRYTNGVNTLPFFRETLSRAGLTDWVIPIVSRSQIAGKQWQTPLAMVFIDGGHTYEAARTDYLTWAPHLMPGGFLVIHDIFFDPAQGGQAPRQVYEEAEATGSYEPLHMVKTLGVLQRK